MAESGPENEFQESNGPAGVSGGVGMPESTAQHEDAAWRASVQDKLNQILRLLRRIVPNVEA